MIKSTQAVCPLKGRMTLKSQNNASIFGSDEDTLGYTSDKTSVVDGTKNRCREQLF
jgi:hypothetical protein